MNFRQIEAFRAIMTHGSVTRAGEALHISQPAVSRLLSDFEQALGVALFERTHRRLVPTAEAHLLYQESEALFGGIDRLREAAVSLRELNRGRIRLVSEVVYADGFLPRLIADYQRGHPGVKVELDTGPSASIAHWIELSWYDLGIVVQPIPQADYRLRPFQRVEPVCAVPAAHRLARDSWIELAGLSEVRMIAPVPDSVFRFHFDRAFSSCGVRPDICLEIRTQHGMCAAVGAGAGVALVDPCVIPDVDDEKVRFLRIRDELFWDSAIIVPRLRPGSLVCNDFTRFLMEQVATE